MHKHISKIQMIKVDVISLKEMRYAFLSAKPNITGVLQLCRVYLKVGVEVGSGSERQHVRELSVDKNQSFCQSPRNHSPIQ